MLMAPAGVDGTDEARAVRRGLRFGAPRALDPSSPETGFLRCESRCRAPGPMYLWVHPRWGGRGIGIVW